MAGAQWTGIVTTIAIEMLKSAMVEAVICVQRLWPEFTGALFLSFGMLNLLMVLIFTVTQTTDLLHDLF